MREELEEYSTRFGAPAPTEAVQADTDIDSETLSEWRTTRRNLAFAEVALALDAVEDVTGATQAV